MHLTWALVADLIGVTVFAASGASAAVAKRLDLFGVVFIGFVSALGGGIIRDLAIGSVPPLAFSDGRYVIAAAVASLTLFWLHPQFNRLRWTVVILDAAGLSLFTVAGTLKALSAPVPAVGAVIIGMLTGIGGGLFRDILTGEIPVVLRREIYAVAALAGSLVVVALHHFGYDRTWPLVGAAALIFGLRLIAILGQWSAPTPRAGLSGRSGDQG